MSTPVFMVSPLKFPGGRVVGICYNRGMRTLLIGLSLAIIFLPRATSARKVVVGGIGGALTYPDAQTSLGIAAGDTIAIQPGVYTGLNFGKLRGTAEGKIVITNNGGLVEVAQSCTGCSSNLTDAVHVVFSGAGAPGLERGFFFHDIPYRALQLNGDMDSSTISDCRFENVADNVVRMNNSTVKFDGTPATIATGLKFLRLSVKNCGNAIDWGDFTGAATLTGIGKDIEIAYNRIDSCQGGEAFRLNKVYRADIHHNTITNMGLGLTSSHPGIVMLRGDGDIHHNHVHNVWGVCARGFGSGLDGTGEIRVYDNLFLGSRKYSSVEAQTFATDLSSDTTSRPYIAACNYRVFNNTMGNQSAADFTAAMVDVYTLQGARCEIRNNLGFNIAKDKAYSASYNYVYNLENPNVPDTSNNIYRPGFADVGLIDSVDCQLLSNSIAVDNGAPVSWIGDDFGGISRPQGRGMDVGAREFPAPTGTVAPHPMVRGSRIEGRSGRIAIHSDFPLRSASIRTMAGRLIAERSWTAVTTEGFLAWEESDGGLLIVTLMNSRGTESRLLFSR